MTDARYYLPVTLDQLQSLQSILDAVSAREADPDAEVFHLLEVVRRTRTDAAKSMLRMQQNASEVSTDPIAPALRAVVWLRDELRAMGFASKRPANTPSEIRN